MKVIVILNGKALVSSLVDVAGTGRFIVGVVSLSMRHRHPPQKRRHCLVLLRAENHVPVIALSLIHI